MHYSTLRFSLMSYYFNKIYLSINWFRWNSSDY